MNRVCIVVVYIGKLPEITKAWLDSCRWNRTFDFMLVTDDIKSNILSNIPDNVFVHFETLATLKEKFQKYFDFDISLLKSYKLCDYRCLYGEAFGRELKGYEWWGYGDNDVIYGDLANFITDNILDDYDRIGMFGHLSLQRNVDFMNQLYRQLGSIFDYREVFSHPYNYNYDEASGLNRICKKNNIKWYKNIPIIDADRFVDRLTDYFNHNYLPEIFYIEGNKFYRAFIDGDKAIRKEYAYLHISSKKPVVPIDLSQYRSFYIYNDRLENRVLGSVDDVYNEVLMHTDVRDIQQDSRKRNRRRFQNIIHQLLGQTLDASWVRIRIYYALIIERLREKNIV